MVLFFIGCLTGVVATFLAALAVVHLSTDNEENEWGDRVDPTPPPATPKLIIESTPLPEPNLFVKAFNESKSKPVVMISPRDRGFHYEDYMPYLEYPNHYLFDESDIAFLKKGQKADEHKETETKCESASAEE